MYFGVRQWAPFIGMNSTLSESTSTEMAVHYVIGRRSVIDFTSSQITEYPNLGPVFTAAQTCEITTSLKH